jgi:hypothetical protein
VAGEMTIHFKHALSSEDLAHFPKTTLAFDVDPERLRVLFTGRT